MLNLTYFPARVNVYYRAVTHGSLSGREFLSFPQRQEHIALNDSTAFVGIEITQGNYRLSYRGPFDSANYVRMELGLHDDPDEGATLILRTETRSSTKIGPSSAVTNAMKHEGRHSSLEVLVDQFHPIL